MSNKMWIELETDSEEALYPLLQHVFREITEYGYREPEVELNSRIAEDWLEIESSKLKGKYKWIKK